LLNVGFIGQPAKPNAPVRLEQISDKTKIAVQWDAVTDGALPAGLITGYRLYIAEGPSG